MKLGFICPSLPGHLNLMTALAHQLQTHNHDVVFLYSAGAAGLPSISADEKGQFKRATVTFLNFESYVSPSHDVVGPPSNRRFAN